MVMEFTNDFNGTLGYVRTRWPAFLAIYGGGALLAVVAIWLSLQRGWVAFVVIILAGVAVLAYFLVASLWAAHQLYDNKAIRDTFFELGDVSPDEKLVHISLGRRQMAVDLSRRLTTGRVIVIDVYNAQLTPSRALARAQRPTSHPEQDPRLSWRDGRINLLPLPDSSVSVVTMNQAASEFWQEGDRDCLFSEIERILAPGGRLLMSERVRSKTNLLVMGPAGIRLKSADFWNQMLAKSGLQPEAVISLGELICCFRADKPLRPQVRQLVLDF